MSKRRLSRMRAWYWEEGRRDSDGRRNGLLRDSADNKWLASYSVYGPRDVRAWVMYPPGNNSIVGFETVAAAKRYIMQEMRSRVRPAI